jgi:preprotein translocase subunit SecE
MFTKVVKYLSEVRQELEKVSWPSRKDTTRMTMIVVGASVAIGLYVGGLDFLFTSLLGFFI